MKRLVLAGLLVGIAALSYGLTRTLFVSTETDAEAPKQSNLFKIMRGVTCGVTPKDGHLHVAWEDHYDQPGGRQAFEWGNAIVLETASVKQFEPATGVLATRAVKAASNDLVIVIQGQRLPILRLNAIESVGGSPRTRPLNDQEISALAMDIEKRIDQCLRHTFPGKELVTELL
jgi:hypothetical protein